MHTSPHLWLSFLRCSPATKGLKTSNWNSTYSLNSRHSYENKPQEGAKYRRNISCLSFLTPPTCLGWELLPRHHGPRILGPLSPWLQDSDSCTPGRAGLSPPGPSGPHTAEALGKHRLMMTVGDRLSRGLWAGTPGPSWSPSRAALLCWHHHLSPPPSGHHPRQKHRQAPPPPRAPCSRVNSSSPSNTSALFSSLHFSSRSAPSCLEKQNSAWNRHRAGPLPGPATCPLPAPPRAPLRPGSSPERHPMFSLGPVLDGQPIHGPTQVPPSPFSWGLSCARFLQNLLYLSSKHLLSSALVPGSVQGTKVATGSRAGKVPTPGERIS